MIDHTIQNLGRKKFRADPIAGPKYGYPTSLMSSAYKRHGKIIERALVERLRQNDRFVVWSEKTFAISSGADNLWNASNLADCLSSQLPYGEVKRTLQIDLLVYDQMARSLRAYEVKRGNGTFDTGKVRSTVRDLACTHTLLKSYGARRGHAIDRAEAKIIFYYGLCSAPKSLSLTREELDEHFCFPVTAAIEEVNGYFRDRLHELIEAE